MGGNEMAKETPERQASELRAAFMESWSRLDASMKEWSNSDNPVIRRLAEECKQALDDANLNPERVKNLPEAEMRDYVKKISAIIAKFHRRLERESAGRRAGDNRE